MSNMLSNLTGMKHEPVSPVVRNVFSSPWRNSDVVLVVEEEEFHVHRSILSIQSPVFEKMFNGPFKEAKQEKIALKEKAADDILQFLKLLYPANMIKAPMISFTTDTNILRMLAIADEYQAEDVITQCLNEIKIKVNNVCQILAYADKYDPLLRQKCISVMERNVTTDTLQGELADLDKTVITDVLFAKCQFLESIINKGHGLLADLLGKVIDGISYITSGVHLENGHVMHVCSFHEARKCPNCLQHYKRLYIEEIYNRYGSYCSQNSNPELLFQILKDMDDVKHAYKAK